MNQLHVRAGVLGQANDKFAPFDVLSDCECLVVT